MVVSAVLRWSARRDDDCGIRIDQPGAGDIIKLAAEEVCDQAIYISCGRRGICSVAQASITGESACRKRHALTLAVEAPWYRWMRHLYFMGTTVSGSSAAAMVIAGN